MEKHIHLIGILWVVCGILGIFAAFVIFGVLFGVSIVPGIGYEASAILKAIGLGVGLFIAVLALPEIIAGLGLLKKREWARIMTLVLSFLSLVNIPLGTALGIYSIIILMKNETIELCKKS